ncbi:MAG: restriction endonuclease subunit S [Methylococcales bacterium]
MEQVNELPQGWKWVRLGDVCDNTTTRNPSLEPNNSFYYVDISSVDNESKKIVSPKLTLGKEASSRARKVILESDVIVSTTRPNLNAVAIIPTELNNQIASTGFCVLRANSDLLDSQYLFSFVQSLYFIENLSDLVNGALYPAVTDKQVFSQYIPLAPFPEQQRLATLLTAKLALIEQAKEKITAQLQAAQELTAAYLREVFESEEAKGWEWVKLQELCKVIGGNFSANIEELNNEDSIKERVYFIRVSDLSNEKFINNNLLYGSENYFSIKNFVKNKFIDKNSIIFPKRGGAIATNKKKIINVPFVIDPNMMAVQSKSNNLNIQFLYYWFLSWDLSSIQSGSSVPQINQKDIEPLLIPLISPDEQTQLANYLSEKLATVEQLKATLQTQLDSINQLPAALLKQAFSGKL